MNGLATFLNMGGYAFFVWTAYGVAFAVLAANLISSMLCQRRLRQEIQRRARRARRSL